MTVSDFQSNQLSHFDRCFLSRFAMYFALGFQRAGTRQGVDDDSEEEGDDCSDDPNDDLGGEEDHREVPVQTGMRCI